MDKLATIYARALFQIASEKNAVDEYSDQLNGIYEMMRNNREFLSILCHPQILTDEKMSIIEKAFKDKVSDDILGFFYAILRKKRESEIFNIFESFIAMVLEHKKQATAIVSSAIPLSESQIYDIRAKLSQKIKKEVSVKVELDAGLIAGFKITVDNRIIDTSVKHQFDNIKKELLQVQLV